MNTCHAFYAATTVAGTITHWWTLHPNWQLGIRTGGQSGLVVLDIDVDTGGLDSLIRLQRDGLFLEGGTVQLSGSRRSFHLLYAHPGGVVPCSQGCLGEGLDVRGDGGYVVGAPSLHPATGSPYELLGGLSGLPVWPLPPARQETRRHPLPGSRQESNRQPLPGSRQEANRQPHALPLSPRATAGRLSPARLDALLDRVSQAPVGKRRDTLFWAACRLGECAGRQSDLVSAAKALLRAARGTGLGDDEAYATVLDGVRQRGRS